MDSFYLKSDKSEYHMGFCVFTSKPKSRLYCQKRKEKKPDRVVEVRLSSSKPRPTTRIILFESAWRGSPSSFRAFAEVGDDSWTKKQRQDGSAPLL
ncbi:hypothetical protein SADUNF_Sadunf10G0152900 [Salix dunnii]|uniref:Uncharacterized protein n=1 Tax=Salix dunnii TaxID=1413687 RepID=A0A835JUC3_9ROSI|nr:hypothetical protein SADUNF_Sadunf10G0152900 [Salix dunnii]